ncbi:hypothetical protein WICPIJ_008636 [Wickerhamomyces pijperi]|uniref:Uncharacterized protein n=1 Tax=Wickerhamomyces pijperi TaxID=599730 RepID=A0A9P8THY9_WICPI|nr:hypothetical protein WICPIJ_008636 [Wickerhamomyces pijperi]
MKLPNHILLLLTLALSSYASLLGIDFGQSFIKAVVIAPGVPFEIVMSSDSKRKDVSAVSMKPLPHGDKDDIERYYGSATNSITVRSPQFVLSNYKSLLGQDISSESAESYLKTHQATKLTANSKQPSIIEYQVSSDQSYPIEQVFAMQLQDISSRASLILKDKSPGGYSMIDDIVITVPAYYNHSQRQAIIDSAVLAGFKSSNVKLVDDGLAVAVDYASKREFDEDEKHIVYDMGSGATKATLVSFTKNPEESKLKIDVEGYAYDQTLGGEIFTTSISDLIKSKFLAAYPKISSTSFGSNHRSSAKVQQSAERAKLVLSANNEAHVSIESIYEDIDFKCQISRTEFEQTLTEHTERITKPILQALESSSLALKDIKSVILVGGGLRVPFVQGQLQQLLGDELISRSINSDEAAVFGATVRGVALTKAFKAKKEMDVKDYSVADYHVSFGSDEKDQHLLFGKGSTYDVKKSVNITDIYAEGKEISLDVWENATKLSHHNTVSTFKHSLNETLCLTPVEISAQFGLSDSRQVKLESIEAHCNVTAEGKVSKSTIFFKTESAPGQSGIDSSERIKLKNQLQLLQTRDSQRRLISEKLNELETELYRSKAYLEDIEEHEDVQDIKAMIDQLKETTNDYMEWLDYDSEGAKLKEIKLRIQKITHLRSEIEKFIQESKTEPLTLDLFMSLNDIVDDMLKSTESTFSDNNQRELKLSEEYDTAGLNFTKETTKLTKASQNVPKKAFQTARQNLLELGQNISEIINLSDEEFQETDAISLFKLRELATEALDKVDKTKSQFLKGSEQRYKELKRGLVRGLKAKKRIADKTKKEQEEKLKEDEDAEEVFEDAQENIETEESNVHDEL